MKKTLFILMLATFSAANFYAYEKTEINTSASPKSGYFDVNFQNKCSKDITLKIQSDGSASSGTLYAGKTERKPVKAGYKIYANDHLVTTISESDAGKTIVVCD